MRYSFEELCNFIKLPNGIYVELIPKNSKALNSLINKAHYLQKVSNDVKQYIYLVKNSVLLRIISGDFIHFRNISDFKVTVIESAFYSKSFENYLFFYIEINCNDFIQLVGKQDVINIFIEDGHLYLLPDGRVVYYTNRYILFKNLHDWNMYIQLIDYIVNLF